MNETFIEAKKISKIYKLSAEDIYAVRDLDLNIKKGEFVSIMGPSGSGKTTLLDIIGCLDSISEGQLEVLGKDISNLKESELVNIRRSNIGYIFQEFFLIPTLTAKENVEVPLIFRENNGNNKKSRELLDLVGLGHRINHFPKQLSGGEKQRVAIARSLVTDPQILIADEPTGNLDTKNSEEIFEIFRKLNYEYNVTIIIATHDPNIGSKADRTLILRDGRIDNDIVNQ